MFACWHQENFFKATPHHIQANPVHDAVVTHLCEELNTTETHCPGTNLRRKYIPLRSSTFLLDQDV